MEYAIDILKDELNELIEFQYSKKDKLPKQVYNKRKKELSLALKILNGETVKSREVCSNSEHKPAHSITGFCSICQCVSYLPEQTE